MNSKVLMIVVTLLVVGGAGFFLLSKNNTSQKTESTMPTKAEEKMSENIVEVTSSGFNPQTITVKAGAKVTWTNKSGDMTNVSSDPHPIHSLYPPLNLGNFDDGKSVSLVFEKIGKYTYHNHLNPSQTGVVVVE